jgi:uncharacterized protein HemX
VYYRLEDIDTASVSTFHGPISITPTVPAAESLTGFAATNDARDSVLILAWLVLGVLGFTFWQRR